MNSGDTFLTHEPTSVDIAEAITKKLKSDGVDGEVIDRVVRAVAEIQESEIPELKVLGAVRQLRKLMATDSDKQPALAHLSDKPKYSFKDSALRPVDFLLKYYAEDLKNGVVGPGQIQRYDINLYMGLHRYVKSLPADESKTLTEFFAELGERGKSWSPVKQRLQACASILGTDEVSAARFLGSVRPERSRIRGG